MSARSISEAVPPQRGIHSGAFDDPPAGGARVQVPSDLTPIPRPTNPEFSRRPPHTVIFGSMRFPVPAEARILQAAIAAAGYYLKIVDMKAGQDIDQEVYEWIKHADTFMVFGTRHYGEDTGNSACTYKEAKFAQAKGKRVILLRMIPWSENFDFLQADVLFNQNMLTLEWQLGTPMPSNLPPEIIRAVQPQASAAADTGPASAGSAAAPLLLATPAAAGQSLAAAADEPEPEPEDDAESIVAFLAGHNLAKYATAVVDEGYATVSDLLTADADELPELAQTLKLKKPEVRRFLKAGTCLSPR